MEPGIVSWLDVENFRGTAEVCQDLYSQRDSIPPVLLLRQEFQLSRCEDTINPGRWVDSTDLPDGIVDPRLEAIYILEPGDIHREQEVAISPGIGAPLHVPKLGAIRRSRQHRREDAHDHRQRSPLVAADWHEQPLDGQRWVRRRLPLRVKSPPLWDWLATLLVDADLAVR